MARQPSWYDRAARVIAAALDEGRAKGLAGRALLDHVDAAYPFGQRAYHPYAMWLKARRKLCGRLGPLHAPTKADCLDDLDFADGVAWLSPRTALAWLLELAAARPELAAHPIMDRAQELAAGAAVRAEDARLVLDVVRAEVAPLWRPRVAKEATP